MQPGSQQKKTTFLLGLTWCLLGWACLSAEISGAAPVREGLWLSSTPQQSHGDKTHGPSPGKRGKPGGAGQSHGGHESEHRPQPLRTYWLNTCQISEQAEAFVTRPEGAVEPVAIERDGHEVKLAISTPMGEGPSHGANHLYLVDRTVENGILLINTAKWLTIHHNCGWGHDHRFNPARQAAQPFAGAPLEIVVERLWDTNFHSNVMSGDQISFRVLSFGRPAPGATVVIESDRGWQKRVTSDQEGRGIFQLVRDYYPEAGQLFDRSKTGVLRLRADYETGDGGQSGGQDYARTRMSSTFSWRYYPARREYVSTALGLLIAL
ncbi:MAG TPA: hypothetical protein VLA15_10610, partial [Desulfurivibrionaceae bacterium]|nr:hypothetical protein [Desulfurivibrionaceae bacterium]